MVSGGGRKISLSAVVHWRGRTVVDQQRQQFGAGVMPNGIHHALTLDDQRHIEIGDQDAFAAGQRRNYMTTFGRDDCGHAAAA